MTAKCVAMTNTLQQRVGAPTTQTVGLVELVLMDTIRHYHALTMHLPCLLLAQPHAHPATT